MRQTHHSILSYKTGHILYEGLYDSFKACLESAVRQRIALNHADLRSRNLSNAELDDAILPNADFTASNLTGANLSESCLDSSIFRNCALYNVCFAYSSLRDCDFAGASFGGTDISACDISGSVFTTLSCFSLSFVNVRSMRQCRFINPDGTHCAMSKPPVVIQGFEHSPIVFMDRHLKIKNQLRPLRGMTQHRSRRALFQHDDIMPVREWDIREG